MSKRTNNKDLVEKNKKELPKKSLTSLTKYYNDLSIEDQDQFLEIVRSKNIYYKIEGYNDKLTIDIEDKNKKLKYCYDYCCFIPSTCCYLCSLWLKICISAIFITLIIFVIVMIKRIFI